MKVATDIFKLFVPLSNVEPKLSINSWLMIDFHDAFVKHGMQFISLNRDEISRRIMLLNNHAIAGYIVIDGVAYGRNTCIFEYINGIRMFNDYIHNIRYFEVELQDSIELDQIYY